MNKEQLRKELEDAMRFDNDNYAATGQEWLDMKETYITTRLAALDDGNGMDSKKVLQNTLNGAWEEIRRLRALLETDSTGNELLRSIYQICERKGENTNWEAITKKVKERLEVQPKPLDDGQEGKVLVESIRKAWVEGWNIANSYETDDETKYSNQYPISWDEMGYAERKTWFLATYIMSLNKPILPSPTMPEAEVGDVFSAEELERAFYRSSNEGYRDAKIKGKKQENFHALVNHGQAKDWFKWLSSKNIPK